MVSIGVMMRKSCVKVLWISLLIYSLKEEISLPNPSIKGKFPSLNHIELQMLSNHVTLEEVKRAVFEMGPTKASGCNRLNAFFHQHQWGMVGHSLVKFVQDAFELGRFPEEMDSTLIALIIKIDNPENYTHFRSISLYNVSYKVLSKILANCMREVLPKLIKEGQTSFFPNRSINENIIIAQEAAYTMRRKREAKSMVVKIDLNKAYDYLRWEFIEDTLRDAQFLNNFIRLLMFCLNSVFIQMVWNGTPIEVFFPSRGVH